MVENTPTEAVSLSLAHSRELCGVEVQLVQHGPAPFFSSVSKPLTANMYILLEGWSVKDKSDRKLLFSLHLKMLGLYHYV